MGDMDLRPEIRQFAEAMEKKLRENDHKGGWHCCSINYLFERLQEEMEELCDAVYTSKRDPDKVWREAADVANFVMIIADVATKKEARDG